MFFFKHFKRHPAIFSGLGSSTADGAGGRNESLESLFKRQEEAAVQTVKTDISISVDKSTEIG